MSIQVLKESTPRARKPHRCSLCDGPIRPGETYIRTTNAYDGSVYDWLKCPACERDRIMSHVGEWTLSIEDGVSPELAHEWATDAADHATGDEQKAAKNFLERSGCDAD